jgi:hypothetical protein
VTSVALVLVGLSLLTGVQIVETTLILVAIGLLPWLYALIESAELPGGFAIRFHLRQLQNEQARQGLGLDTLRFLITHFISSDELEHPALSF